MVVQCWCASLIADVLFNSLIFFYNDSWFSAVNLALCRVPVFVVGCFIAFYVKKDITIKNGWVIFGGVIIAPVLVWALTKYKSYFLICGVWRYMYGMLACIVVLLLALCFDAFDKESMINRLFGFFGKYTLEIYLIHTQLLSVLSDMIGDVGTLKVNILAAILSIPLAMIVNVVVGSFSKMIIKKCM